MKIREAFSTLRTLSVSLLFVLIFLQLSHPAKAQSGPPQGRPIVFLHGYCSSAADWASLAQTVANYTIASSNLYTNSTLYTIYYDPEAHGGLGAVKLWPSGVDVLGGSVPQNARFFLVNFTDPTSWQDPSNFSPLNVAQVSVLNKADEVAQIIATITTLTHIKDTVVFGHSMGGLDARAYLQNLARPSLSMCTDQSDPPYSCLRQAPPTYYTDDISTLVTLDTPHGGVDTAFLSYVVGLADLYSSICYYPYNLNARELDTASALIYSLNSSASVLPTTLTLDSIASYTVPSLFNPNQNDDGVVTDTAQSLTYTLEQGGYSFPQSQLEDLVNGWYLVPVQAGCLSNNPRTLLHELACLENQWDTVPVLEHTIDEVLAGTPGSTTSLTIQATLDGNPWEGSVNYQVNGPGGFDGSTVPANFYDLPLGTYSLQYLGGGPSGHYVIVPISQTLGVDHATGGNTWALNFAIAFCSSTCPSPTVTSSAPTDIAGDGAKLHGTVNPNGLSTTAWFEWSVNSNLQNAQSTPPQSIPASNNPVAIPPFNLTGLESSTTYYYAAAASAPDGGQPTLGSPIEQFQTLSTLPAPVLVAPANGAGNVSTPPNFSWTAVQGSTSYRLIVATNTQALPTDPTNPNCGAGCVMNATPENNSYIPAATLAPNTTYYWEVHARSPLQYGTWSSPIFSFTTAGPSLIGLTIVPSTVPSGNNSTLTATLSGPAPNGGINVILSSTNQSAFPVSNITIPAGNVMGSITVQAGTVSTSTTVTVTASYNNSRANATVTVNPIGGSGAVLSSVSVSPSTIVGGLSPLGSVYLTGSAPSNGATVQLSSNNQHFVQVPASVTVQPGYTSATFPVTTTFTSSPVGATILGMYNQTEYGTSLTVLPVAISGVTFFPSTVTAGNSAPFTVYLNGPAPSGAVLSLSSSNPSALQVPSTVQLPTGALSVQVSATTFAVSTQTSVIVTATYNGSSGQGTGTVVPIALNGLDINPLTITGGNNGTGTVWISSPAPSGGVAVTLSSSNNSILQVPSTVMVPSGSVSNTFVVSTSAVQSINNVTVTASYGGVYDNLVVSVVPPLPLVSALTFSPATVPSGSPTTGTVTLTAPAPLGGIVVSLTSTVPYSIANVPQSIVVPPGSTSANFSVNTSPISFIQPATVTASYNNSQQSAVFIVAPPGTPLAPASLMLTPGEIVGGNAAAGSVLLTETVPAGGIVLSLSSDNPDVTVPSVLSVPAGVNTAQFVANTSSVQVLTTATISAAFNGIAQSSLLTVRPSGTPPPNNPVPFIATPLMPLTSPPGGGGLVLTLGGAGFVPGARVFWNSTPLSTTFLSGTKVEASVPSSDLQTNQTATVSVENPGSVSAASNALPEHLSYATSTPSFINSLLTGSGEPYVVAAADFNGDGKLDLVVGKVDGSGVSLFLGNGDGTFGSERLLTNQGLSSSIAIGDINGDGKKDFVLNSSVNNGMIAVFLGNGDGTFTAAPSISISISASSVLALGDFNGDGNLDMVATSVSPNHGVYILLGNGDGTFQSPINVGSVVQPYSVAVADFDGDGKLDVAMTDASNQAVAILFGNGDGTFRPQVEFPANGYANSLVAADLNGDGLLDIAVANEGPVGGNAGGLSVLLNMGHGTFALPVNYAPGSAFYSVASDDVNGDGKLDVLVSNPPNGVDLLFLGNGDGTFSSSPVTFPAGSGTFIPTIADLNNDGAPDIIIPSYNSGNENVSILLQNIQPVLLVAPLNLSFTAVAGGGSPPPASIQISNTGGGTVNWIATSSQSWLIISPTSGSAPAEIAVTVNPTGLVAGNYSAIITVAATGASNSPQNIAVALTISPAQVVISSLTFNPGSLIGPGSSTGTVTLSGPAPNGGATATLSSDNPAVQVPATMNVAAGQTSGTFTATVSAVSNETTATVTATYNQAFTTAALTAEPGMYSVLFNFSGGRDGAYPSGGLTMDGGGNLYGNTLKGGNGNGVAFKLSRRGSGWTINPLYAFQGGSDGAGPVGKLIIGSSGILYGVTTAGGTGVCSASGFNGCGTVFTLRPGASAPRNALTPWNENVIYRFTGGNDGAQPSDGALVFDSTGNVYGTTLYGGSAGSGSCNGSNCGTAYTLSRSGNNWIETVIHNFGATGDGAVPHHGVVFDRSGNLFGTTYQGGNAQAGIVFELMPSGSNWIESVPFSFAGGTEGTNPYNGVIFDNVGDLFGATSTGGLGGAGAVYELTPSNGGWTASSIYAFIGNANSGPYGELIMDAAGNLYGTTQTLGGYGTAFKLTLSNGAWVYTQLHQFTGGADGGIPVGGLMVDGNGNIYGTTSVGGAHGYGTVFEITP
jgi:pimeloyl-ACP methyl ester carboxylesterase